MFISFLNYIYICLSVSPCIYLYTWEQTSHSRKNSVRFLCLEVQVAVKPNFFCKITVFCKRTLNYWAIFLTCVSPIWSLLSISFTVLKLRFSTLGFISDFLESYSECYCMFLLLKWFSYLSLRHFWVSGLTIS